MTDEPKIIVYRYHGRNDMNRQHKRALDKELSKIGTLKKIDLAFEKAVQEVDFDYGFLLGFFRGEFEKECIRLENMYKFQYFTLNLDFIEQKYGMPKDSYKNEGISIINKIRKFVNRFK